MTPFTLPQLATKAVPWDEHKHPRDHGRFSHSQGARGATPTPRMGRLVSSGPSRRNGPPPLPGRAHVARLDDGKPPGQLGAPKNAREAHGQYLWLLHRAARIRLHVRENAHRLTAEQRADLTGKVKLAIHLAARLGTGQFRLPDAAHEPAGPRREPEARVAVPTPVHAPPADPRHNPDLDAVFNSPAAAPAAKPAQQDIRHNPELDALFGDRPTPQPKPADQPRAGHGEPKPKKPRKGKGGKKAREREATALATDHFRLSAEADERGDTAAASGFRVAGSLFHHAAEHHSQGNHKLADELRNIAHEYAGGKRKVGDARKAKAFALPPVDKTLWDEHKHRRGNPQNRGQFAPGGQNRTATFTAPAHGFAPGRHANPQAPSRTLHAPGHAANHHGPDPDAKALTWAARIREVPGKLRTQVASFVRGRYRRLVSRYGATGAKAILAATILLAPAPIPGTSFIPIALAEAVLFLRRAMGKTYAPPLDEATIRREAKALLADLYRECGETWPGHDDHHAPTA